MNKVAVLYNWALHLMAVEGDDERVEQVVSEMFWLDNCQWSIYKDITTHVDIIMLGDTWKPIDKW